MKPVNLKLNSSTHWQYYSAQAAITKRRGLGASTTRIYSSQCWRLGVQNQGASRASILRPLSFCVDSRLLSVLTWSPSVIARPLVSYEDTSHIGLDLERARLSPQCLLSQPPKTSVLSPQPETLSCAASESQALLCRHKLCTLGQ